MKTRGESEANQDTIPAYSRAAGIYRVKSSDAGNTFRMQDGAQYVIATDGSIRHSHKGLSKKQRNKLKREARKGSAA